MGMWFSAPLILTEAKKEEKDYAPVPTATAEPVRIRHRPTCHDPDLEAPAEPVEKRDGAHTAGREFARP